MTGSPSAGAAVPRARQVVALLVAVVVIAAVGFVIGHVTKPAPRGWVPVNPPARDRFEHGNGQLGLGRAETRQIWRSVAGVWGIRGGSAVVVKPAPAGGALNVLTVAGGPATVRVVFDVVVPGAGVAFRCPDARNCWRLVARPELGTWNLSKVVRGRTTELGNVGLAAVAPGTAVDIRLSGPAIDITVAGQHVRTVRDHALQGVAGAGLWVAPEGDWHAARWAAFSSVPTPRGRR